MVRPISTDSLFFIFSRTLENNTHIKRPKMIPPNIMLKNDKTHSQIAPPVTCPSRIIPRITRNKASDVPSLNMLSPSNIRASLRGAQTVLNIERTATGSVEEIRAQNKRQTRNGISKPRNGKIKYSALATRNADIITHPTARVPIVFQFRRSSL